MTTSTRIGIAVVERRGRFLVGTRGDDGPLAGYDEFPGGKCRDSESQSGCAQRECREETGLDVRATELLFECEHQYAHGAVSLQFWLCRPETDLEPTCGQWRWVHADRLCELKFPEANAPVVELLQRRSIGMEYD